MTRRKVYISSPVERSLLSDVLPFETPVSFTNRHYYNFVLKYGIKFKNNKINWNICSPEEEACILIILSLNSSQVITVEGRREYRLEIFRLAPQRPFLFPISHKSNEFRHLTIPPIRAQLELVDFYKRSKEAIMYFTSLSSFSIRYPAAIAQYTYFDDRLHSALKSEDLSGIEQHSNEYPSLRSFFRYKDYSNVYKFYESYKFQRCEKKYERLLKLDISKCFDSMYSHSIVWATHGLESVKQDLSLIKEGFSARFDALMQRSNNRETNGIIIGAEYSRIFAEIILQKVDLNLEMKLLKSHQLVHRRDYEIFRYVDDYFIFYINEEDRNRIEEELSICLKEYKLSLNSEKYELLDKPIITNITRAKNQISNLLEKFLPDRAVDKTDTDTGEVLEKAKLKVDSRSLIVEFKSVLKSVDVEYKDVMNYSLAVVNRKTNDVLNDYSESSEEFRRETKLVNALLSSMDFLFFIYSVSPRVNTTIKLCRILELIISFCKNDIISSDNKHRIFKAIFDSVGLILRKARIGEYAQVESLYLLICLSTLGKHYWLEEDALLSYFGLSIDESGVIKNTVKLNYFSITVMFMYMRDKKRYSNARSWLEGYVVSEMKMRPDTVTFETEYVMLFFDLVGCPYVSVGTKEKLLNTFIPDDSVLRASVESVVIAQDWFTSWTGFDFGLELDSKLSREVY